MEAYISYRTSGNIIQILNRLFLYQAEGVAWDEFYELRKYPANFIIRNDVPDENLVEFFKKGVLITSSIEFGCGEGRNAIFMAKQGVCVTTTQAVLNQAK